MFDSEAYRPYIELCRKLALGTERRLIQVGDWYIDRNDEPRCIGWHPDRVAFIEGAPIWLPRLDQWLDLVTDATFAKHPQFREADGSRYLARRDALNAIAKYWTDHPTVPAEMAAACTYCAVTGRVIA